MFFKKKKISARRQQVRNTIAADRFIRLRDIANSPYPAAVGILILFSAGCIYLLSLDICPDSKITNILWTFKGGKKVLSIAVITALNCLATAFYIFHYQPRIIRRTWQVVTLAVLLWILLALTRIGSLYPQWIYLATGTSVASAIILTIVYNQRFALGLSLFYAILVCFAVERIGSVEMLLTIMSGVIVCCFSLREIRSRMKLVWVCTQAAAAVFVVNLGMGILQEMNTAKILSDRVMPATIITLAIGILLQAFLPAIERLFRIATSMTLMEYSDANQPLLKKLAMEAPGTFSHSLLIGSIAEAAAEAIGCNGLLCRVGAYYHDIGKINKPGYFVENQIGSVSRHEQLSPAMSQLVIVGHVKDGIEIAREYSLPVVLQEFIETHHGTTLMEYFYNEARKRQDEKMSPVSEVEFRYPGPKPRTKEAAILMLADACEGATRSMSESTATRIETMVHTIAMKRLQDGQFDECDLTLKELSRIEDAMAKSLTAHRHGRIAYPGQNAQDESRSPSPIPAAGTL